MADVQRDSRLVAESSILYGYVPYVSLYSLLSGEDQQNGVVRVQTGGPHYEYVAASQTDQVCGATGAAGDYLGRLVCVVTTAATASVLIQDGAGTAREVLPNSPGGGVGTYTIELGIKSTAGAWSITTGAGVAVLAIGNFT